MPSLHVATFNVHHCEGLDGRVDVRRVAEVVAATGADLVALQELDRGMERSGRIDQPRELEDLVGMSVTFHPTLRRGGGEYGIAIATRSAGGPFVSHDLPRIGDEEPRAYLIGPWRGLTVVATHLSLRRNARDRQLEALAQVISDIAGPFVVLGDLNVGPWGLRRVDRGRFDVPLWPRRTMARRWSQRDHVVAGGGARVARRRALPTRASDHYPLVAEIALA